MKKPSPAAHLIRLALVGVVFLVTFLSVKSLATPATWNHDMDNWFRLKSLDDMQQQKPAYANDNKACGKSCHEEIFNKQRKKKHIGVACDSCHGALANHIDISKVELDDLIKGKFESDQRESLKKAKAPVAYGWPKQLQEAHEKNGGTVVPEGASVPVVVNDATRASVMWQCRNCHLKMINKPANFKQFRPDPEKFKKHVEFVSGQVKKKDDNKDVMCLSCHDPHDPTP